MTYCQHFYYIKHKVNASLTLDGIQLIMSSSMAVLLNLFCTTAWFLSALPNTKVSTHYDISVSTSYCLTEYSMFRTMLACCVEITSFCSSTSSRASVVHFRTETQSAPSWFIPTLTHLGQYQHNIRSSHNSLAIVK